MKNEKYSFSVKNILNKKRIAVIIFFGSFLCIITAAITTTMMVLDLNALKKNGEKATGIVVNNQLYSEISRDKVLVMFTTNNEQKLVHLNFYDSRLNMPLGKEIELYYDPFNLNKVRLNTFINWIFLLRFLVSGFVLFVIGFCLIYVRRNILREKFSGILSKKKQKTETQSEDDDFFLEG